MNATHLEVDGGSNNSHGLRVVPQHRIGTEAALPPLVQLL